MREAPTYLGPAGGQVVIERLALYRRYAELVAEQEHALEGDDLDRFQDLSDEIEALREEIGTLDPEDIATSDEAAVQAASDALRGALATNRRIQKRLSRMRGDQAGRIKEVARRRPQTVSYLERDEDEGEVHLDVKL